MNNIIDVNENDFENKVLEESLQKLVVVDFWAPWCGPCKQLTPILEKTITPYPDKIILAKINIDENQQLAAQLQIQSIPTVVAVKEKKIANGFQGALPKTKIIEFIEKILGGPLKQNNDQIYSEINVLFQENKWQESKNLIEEHLASNSDDIKIISMYIKCLANLDAFEELKVFTSSISENLINDPIIKKEISNSKMIQSLSKGEEIEVLISNYENNPKNIENILILSDKYFYEKKNQNAFDLLLQNYLIFKEKDREKIKKKLIHFFDILGNEHDLTKIYRKKLSSLLFS